MQEDLSRVVSGRITENPAAVLRGITVISQDGWPHPRRWDGIVDTGADVSIIPRQIALDLNLTDIGQKVRVSSYRKDDPPRELAVFYVQLSLGCGFILPTRAILSERRNILIGRSALCRMRLTIDWPANWWSLEELSLPEVPKAT